MSIQVVDNPSFPIPKAGNSDHAQDDAAGFSSTAQPYVYPPLFRDAVAPSDVAADQAWHGSLQEPHMPHIAAWSMSIEQHIAGTSASAVVGMSDTGPMNGWDDASLFGEPDTLRMRTPSVELSTVRRSADGEESISSDD